MWLGRGTTVFMRNILRRPCQKANLIVCKTGTKIVVQYEECTIRINDCLTQMKKTNTKGEDTNTAQDPHLDRQREIQAAQADIQYKDQGTQFPQNPRAMEQYATIREAPSRTILLHLVPVKVIAPGGSSLTTYALLDNASRGTIITKNIANSLALKGPLQLVYVNTVVEKTSKHFQLVRFKLQSATGTGEIIKVEEGLVSEKFNIPERCLIEDIDNSCYPHLKDTEIPEV
ncbi:unnamed protein product [Porites lobata]|uniref:Uncharacterized protein n=1 Tax=Porites lobata TaxID=104759 RepID=A0ABN8NTV5_9CNID|nr:unnamed protein product [Porites lobata]